MKKNPYRIWRILHRAKVAKRNGDITLLNKLAREYAKVSQDFKLTNATQTFYGA